MTRPVALLVTFSAVFCLGCDAVQPDGRTPSTTSSDGPRLLTWEGPSDRSMEAIVSGKLRVNGAGCFTLDDNLLMAPPGSEVVREGAGIAVPGLGEFDIGETVRGGRWLPLPRRGRRGWLTMCRRQHLAGGGGSLAALRMPSRRACERRGLGAMRQCALLSSNPVPRPSRRP